MTILHMSDLHLTEGPRLADQVEVLNAILEIGRDAGVIAWILAGDLFGRTVPHASTPAERHALLVWLRAATETAPVIIVRGNHDHVVDLAGLAHVGGTWPVHVLLGAEMRRILTPGGTMSVYGMPYPQRSWLLQSGATPGLTSTDAANVALAAQLQLFAGQIARRRRTAPAEHHVLVAHLSVTGASLASGEVIPANEISVSPEQLMDVQADYVALGHLHLNQEVGTDSICYTGSPWRTDFGEREPQKFVHLVDLGTRRSVVRRVPTPCRDLLTLDWRWGDLGGATTWTTQPDVAQLDAVRGAEVRARLVVPAQHAAACPWAAVLQDLEARGAHRVVSERVIEPTQRVRAPEVAEAQDLPGKVTAYWGTVATPPTPDEASAAQEALGHLTECDDVEALIARILAGA